MNRFVCRVSCFAIAATFVFAGGGVSQAERLNDENVETVNWFDAMDDGTLDVKIILQDSTKGNVLVKNKTDKVMMVRLPETFAAVPALGQFGGGGGGGFGGGGGGGGLGGGGGGGQQAGGGGLGGGGGGLGGGGGGGFGGGGGGFMRVAPEKVRRVGVNIVCLEHGKKDPNPKVEYKMVRLEDFSDDERISVVCEALGRNQLTQKTAQAAAWNIMDNLSWNALASKNKVESKYLGNIRWFSPMELRTAQAVVTEATRLATARSEESDRYSGGSHSE